MSDTLAILGRQPALGLAELESLYGPTVLRPVGQQAAWIRLGHEQVALDRLGGTIKLAKVLTVMPTTRWPELVAYLAQTLPEHTPYVPEGKLKFGLSAYGLAVDVTQLNKAGLELKKVIRGGGRSVRVVPNTELHLSSAQTLHNQLTSALGMELILVRDEAQTVLAQVVAVQDIAAYTARDQERPKRDARVGMLPPKLAQIILNLAHGRVASNQSNTTVLDPFCGTGVILQEAMLMGFNALGTDLEPRMVDYAKTNIEWLRQRFNAVDGLCSIDIGDATDHHWPANVTAVASETYLGRPLSTLPDPQALQKIVHDVDTIHQKFLKNLASQTGSGFRMTLAVPAWKTPQGFVRLPSLEKLEALGYNRVSFVHVRDEELVYHRPGQFVGRELVTMTRK